MSARVGSDTAPSRLNNFRFSHGSRANAPGKHELGDRVARPKSLTERAEISNPSFALQGVFFRQVLSIRVHAGEIKA
jgi:hypothetical protein